MTFFGIFKGHESSKGGHCRSANLIREKKQVVRMKNADYCETSSISNLLKIGSKYFLFYFKELIHFVRLRGKVDLHKAKLLRFATLHGQIDIYIYTCEAEGK